jgi:adenosylhomocysteine nucleosidase
MTGRTVLIAALPRELAPLVGGSKPERGMLAAGIHLYRNQDFIAVAAGMGADRVARGFEAAMTLGGISEVISIGLAGSCVKTLIPGEVVEAGLVVDVRTGERYRTERENGPMLVSTNEIASVQEKARLAASYGASLVDMEAATVGRLARAHGLRFRAIKGISDAHDFELASLGQFTGKRGEFRTAAFALHTAVRPATWGKTITLGRNSGKALAALAVVARAAMTTT